MQLTEQERLNLITRQKVYAALVSAQEHIEAAIEELDTANSEAHPETDARNKTYRLYERLKAMKQQNFKLLCDVFARESSTINPPPCKTSLFKSNTTTEPTF